MKFSYEQGSCTILQIQNPRILKLSKGSIMIMKRVADNKIKLVTVYKYKYKSY